MCTLRCNIYTIDICLQCIYWWIYNIYYMWYQDYKDTHVPNTSFMSYLSSTVGVLVTLGASSFIFSLGLAFPKRGISVVLVCRPDCLCWCLALWRAHCVRRARSLCAGLGPNTTVPFTGPNTDTDQQHATASHTIKIMCVTSQAAAGHTQSYLSPDGVPAVLCLAVLCVYLQLNNRSGLSVSCRYIPTTNYLKLLSLFTTFFRVQQALINYSSGVKAEVFQMRSISSTGFVSLSVSQSGTIYIYDISRISHLRVSFI